MCVLQLKAKILISQTKRKKTTEKTWINFFKLSVFVYICSLFFSFWGRRKRALSNAHSHSRQKIDYKSTVYFFFKLITIIVIKNVTTVWIVTNFVDNERNDDKCVVKSLFLSIRKTFIDSKKNYRKNSSRRQVVKMLKPPVPNKALDC